MRNERQKVRIGDICYNIIKNKRLVAILTVVGLFAGVFLSALGYVRGEMSKQYLITASVAISAQTANGKYTTKFDTPNKEDFALSADMADAAMYIIPSDGTAAAVVSEIGSVGVSAKSIQNNLDLKRHNETQIIEISLTWRSEKEGIDILTKLIDAANVTLVETLGIGKLNVINPPKSSYIFGGSIKITTLVYATVVGFLAGIIISVLKLLITPKLLRPDDMEKLFGVEVLGTLPFHHRYGETPPLSPLPDVINSEVSSSVNILLNRMERAGIKKIYLTSVEDKEGKTRLVADLAVRIAQSGKRVLAVDCNFKNPNLASLFGADDSPYSLNAVYDGKCDISDAVVRLNGCLFLLPSVLDRRPELTGDAMMDLLNKVFEDYDYVLMDVDSIGNNSDVIRFNKAVQAALFIVKYDYSNMSDIKQALLQISKSGLPVAGCIVNAAKTWREVLRNIDVLVKRTNLKNLKKKNGKIDNKQKKKSRERKEKKKKRKDKE